MMVAGSMIGAGIFIVPAEMAREVGSSGWLLASWAITGILTVAAALSYGELAGMMPRAGGQYVYLREAFSPLWGFLYGWTLLLVIQTGSIAALGVSFSRYLGVLWPWVSESNYLISPVRLAGNYALSLSTAQLIGLLVIVLLTGTNLLGVKYGKRVQTSFTIGKLGSLAAVIAIGVLFGWNTGIVHMNFNHPWFAHNISPSSFGPSAETAMGLIVVLCLTQTGPLFASDAWNNITFTAGEVKNPRRNIPLSLILGTGMVMVLYLCANAAYLVSLSLQQIQSAPEDRVASVMMGNILPHLGPSLMAAAIMFSVFGCTNGFVLSGGRLFYAMARDGLFFRRAATLNTNRVPGAALMIQAFVAMLLALMRTYNPSSGTYGNLYSNLFEYVVAADLMFYILTIAAVFRLRARAPEANRPYRALGYPFLPALYIVGASMILLSLFRYRSSTALPGLVIVLMGCPAYLLFRRAARKRNRSTEGAVTVKGAEV
jgi:APA family basic amino acid/polyamine antiporter